MKHFDLDWNNNHRVWFPKSRLNLSKKKKLQEWKKCLISIPDLSRKYNYKTFEVEYMEDILGYKYIFRPIKPVQRLEFESLFRFGIGCRRFTTSRVIGVKNE